MFKKDKLWLGAIYGVILPILALIFSRGVEKAIGNMVSDGFLYIICIGINVIVFRIAIARKRDRLARGILLSTFIYAFIYFFNFVTI